ncbi:hypothetical protein DOTSEDRAFT_65421 [Dothistroma septosporum NZE10]|uniref:ABC transporter-like protein n=1 Tax=Dothistroma septosporum (strain NZE10 / CBS 128990) TaxID=675120 RepID=N1PEJ7_DOTSN|nr:hypothetical protein DOTSEDRAFT_65421 [Dothistroma septosporum NZE10]
MADGAQSPEQKAGWLSRLTFHWTSSLLWEGYRQPLESKHLPNLHPKHDATDLAHSVQEAFETRRACQDNHPLWSTLYATFRSEFWIAGLCRGVADCLLVLVPFVSRYLIQFTIDSYVSHLRGEDGPLLARGVGCLVAIVGMLAVQSLAHNYYMYSVSTIGGRIRAILVTSIFEKAGCLAVPSRDEEKPKDSAELNTSSKGRTGAPSPDDRPTSAHIVDLISVHCTRIEQTVSAIHMLWTAPLSLCLAITLLIYNLRVSALAGLGLMLLGFSGLIFIVGILFRKRKAIDKITRDRVSLLQETLTGIRLLKLFAWESGVAERISAIRSKETSSQYRYGAVRNLAGAGSQALPVMTAMMAFVTLQLTTNSLSPAVVFSSTSLFTSLRMPLVYIPLCVQACIDSWRSLMRVESFLLLEENIVYPVDKSLKAAVDVHDATFDWRGLESSGPSAPSLRKEELELTDMSDDSSSIIRSAFVLRDIDLTLYRGELVAVVGSVGSGKTSLLSALTGSMAKTYGTVTWGTSYVTCPQQAWILNASVKENITFGTVWDEQRYATVVDAASLRRDLALLPFGDRTTVGERGVVLSGGQKQRIILARAMYSHSDCILLDDPLSAVDANVSRALLDNAICGFMQGRTRLLCTHDTKAVQRCDRVLWMDDGRVRRLDTYQHLIDTDPDFAAFVRGGHITETTQSASNGTSDKADASKATTALQSEEELGGDGNLAQEEDRSTKAVSWWVYGALISSFWSRLLFSICIPLLLVGNGSTVITQLWLSWWSADRYGLPRNTYIGIYVGLAFTQLVFLYTFGFLLNIACAHSTHIMFDRAVKRILQAPVHFFDRTPLGRHMNRLTSDVDKMDNALPETLRMFLISITGLIPIFTIQIVYYRWFGIAVAVLIVTLVSLAIYYRATARETERLQSILRSVVLARLVEGLSGASTLRAYNMYSKFTNKLHDALRDMNSAAFATVAIQRWLSIRQDAMTALALIVLGVLIIYKRETQHPAISGVSLSLMINASQVIQVVVREWAELESAMNATERLHAYANVIPLEEQADDARTSPPKDWPSSGEIQFSDVSMRYRPELPESIKNINLDIEGGEHVAIVGRTGAGKSSIVNVLFRFVAVSSGKLLIDGYDVTSMALKTLRNALSIIPQDTTLFSGTVRSNLDPFGTCTEKELREALHHAHLSRHFDPDSIIQPEGTNLSVGQRQLLALARVLLRKSKILVCDEATSSLDTDTDELIQKTMQKMFRGKTLLCIAHRLRTVLWYDRICVMDAGRVVEFDSPLKLWVNEGGVFRGMCDKAGITKEVIEEAAARRLQLADTMTVESPELSS